MRQAFVHEARIEFVDGDDERAPGAAVTVALCGSWEHSGPCRVPHHTAVAVSGAGAVVRVVAACEPGAETRVRETVAAALAGGRLPVPAPDGAVPTRWRVVEQGSAPVRDDEEALAARLAALT